VTLSVRSQVLSVDNAGSGSAGSPPVIPAGRARGSVAKDNRVAMRVKSIAVVASAVLLSSCSIAPLARPTPDGNWTVVTDPFALVGRSVKVIFRFRDGDSRPPADSFTFTATCTTCPEPKPSVTGTATKDSGGASESLFVGTVTFPTVGTWWTSPYVGPIEVR